MEEGLSDPKKRCRLFVFVGCFLSMVLGLSNKSLKKDKSSLISDKTEVNMREQ